MSQPPPYPQWGAAPPPPPGARPILGRRVAVGIGLAMLAHLISIGAAVLAIVVAGQTSAGSTAWLVAPLGAQLLVFVGCMVLGILGIVRGDGGVGLGLLVGWALGIIVLPVIGFGICVAALSSQGIGG